MTETKKLKVFLLNPPDRDQGKFIREGRCNQEAGVWSVLWPPITLATIAAKLRADGHEVLLRDGAADGMSFENLREILEKDSPDLMVYATASPSIDNDLELSKFIKSINPNIFLVAIGTHVTALDKDILPKFKEIDCIVRGEPELTISELALALKAGDSKEKLVGLKGTTILNSNGEVIQGETREWIEDLDDLPHPAWDLLDLSPYRLPLSGKPFVLLTPHRGCPWKCTYCTAPSYYGNKIRTRSVENVVSEIKNLKENYGIEDYFMWSDTFTGNKRYVRELCKAITPLKIRWTCNSRVDTFDEELGSYMKEAGCWMMSFGIESGNQKVLDISKKGAKVEQAYKAVDAAKKCGIKVAGHFVLGLPGEDESSMNDTLSLAKDLALDVAQFYCAAPFPGTELYDQALENGWIDLNHPKLGKGSSQEIPTMEIPGLSSAKVAEFKKRGYRDFYLSGKPLKLIISNLKVEFIFPYIKNLKRFFRWARSG